MIPPNDQQAGGGSDAQRYRGPVVAAVGLLEVDHHSVAAAGGDEVQLAVAVDVAGMHSDGPGNVRDDERPAEADLIRRDTGREEEKPAEKNPTDQSSKDTHVRLTPA